VGQDFILRRRFHRRSSKLAALARIVSPTYQSVNRIVFNTSQHNPLAIRNPACTVKSGESTMPSDLKSETSRINGAKSRGPITEAGKETSSQNALKHGMTAHNTHILACEREEEYQEFLAEHIAIHLPATPPKRSWSSKWQSPAGAFAASYMRKRSSSTAKYSATATKSKKNLLLSAAAFTSRWQSVSLADESRCL
jgi:hypothetical protein